MSIYLDCNATTPIEPEVFELMQKYFVDEYGNASSRHEYGNNAKKAVQEARRLISRVLNAETGDRLVFTSGATESNNMAIMGLQDYAENNKKKHIICSAIEHKAVLEPVRHLESLGFDVSYIAPNADGVIEADAIKEALRNDTFLVTVMQANNETGVIQPILQICEALEGHPAYFHTDAAQSFGKLIDGLTNKRIDFISVSGHKIYGPKGIGGLFIRRRKLDPIPLRPIMYGGGQENGLRPGTLPVPLIVGLGKAAEIAYMTHEERRKKCLIFREKAINALESLNISFNGNRLLTLPNVINFSIPGIDSESAILVLKDVIALSNGSACTSQNYSPSHVLKAMNLSDDVINGAIRMSWCHMTHDVDWPYVVSRLQHML